MVSKPLWNLKLGQRSRFLSLQTSQSMIKNEKQIANISWPPNPQYCNSLDVINTAEQIFAGEIDSTNSQEFRSWPKYLCSVFLTGFSVHLLLHIFSHLISIDSLFQLFNRKQKSQSSGLCTLRIYPIDTEWCFSRKSYEKIIKQ